MFKKKKNIVFAATLILVSGLLLEIAVGSNEAVIFSNLQWTCPYRDDEQHCAVSFELVNQTAAQQVREVNILGIRISPGKKDANARICGQMNFSILLGPHEVIEIRELMPVVSMPDEITVSLRDTDGPKQ